jgi:hypothetical protein
MLKVGRQTRYYLFFRQRLSTDPGAICTIFREVLASHHCEKMLASGTVYRSEDGGMKWLKLSIQWDGEASNWRPLNMEIAEEN